MRAIAIPKIVDIKLLAKLLLVSLLIATAVLPQVADAGTRDIPDPDYFTASTHVWLVASRVGAGNSLDAEAPTVRIYYDNPTGNSFIIRNGQDRCGYPGNGSGVDGSPSRVVDTDFWFNNVVGDVSSNPNNYSLSFAGFRDDDDLSCGDVRVNLGRLSPLVIDAAGTQKYVVQITAHNTTPGTINAFRIVAEDGGIGSFFSGSGTKFALQDREAWSASPGSNSDFRLPFSPSCNIRGNSNVAWLTWTDDDYNQSNQRPGMYMELYENGTRIGSVNSGTGAQWWTSGFVGQGGNGWWMINVREGANYEWVWRGVTERNGIQFQLPFDSFYANFNCRNTPPNPSCTLSASPSTITLGDSTTLSWTSSNATSGTINPGSYNMSPIGSGSRSVTPGSAGSATYTATVRNSAGTTSNCSTTITVEEPFHAQIFSAGTILFDPNPARDNNAVETTFENFMWTNAGLRGATNRQFVAGIYGNSRADTGERHPRTITQINTEAEDNCPGINCTLPLAYVPQNDGEGEQTTSTKDGSTTPNGNRWMSLRNESYSSGGGFSSRFGGIASNINNTVDGFRGNQIYDVEISNIRVEAIDVETDSSASDLRVVQGGVNDDILQLDKTNLNLPPGSQGPVNAANNPINTWDNIRNPAQAGSGFTVAQTESDFDYFGANYGLPQNFRRNPFNMNNYYSSPALEVKSGNVVTILQDGNDPDGYPNKNEPFTYSDYIARVDQARIKWDEYIDWSQVDDKGHYYPTRGTRSIGVNWGPGTSGRTATTYSISASGGSPTYTDPPPSCTRRDRDGNCTATYDPPPYVNNYATQCVSPTYVYYNYNSRGYYYGGSESQHGWKNTSTSGGANIGYGSQGQTAFSSFGPNLSSNPSWSNTTSANVFWQDTNQTPMSNVGSTNRPSHTNRWILDRSDPAYTGRYIFGNYSTPSFITGYGTAGTQCASGYSNSTFTSTPTTHNIPTYYASASNMYEYTACPGTTYSGQCNVTYDGNRDGAVDTGWAWTQNLQRVRYENTFPGRYRKAGSRCSSGCDDLLYGLDDDVEAGATRGEGRIENPTIGVENADVFGGGGISSYFSSSNAASAFLFSNGYISSFSSSRSYPGYYFNPDLFEVRIAPDYSADGTDAIESIIGPGEIEDLNDSAESIGSSISGDFNLGQNSDRTYVRSGNLRLNNARFTNGAGTIIVEGDLIIEGSSVSYPSSSVSSRSDVPSVGFLVYGDILIRPSVDNIVGSYLTNGMVHTGSILLNNSGNGTTALNDRVGSDDPFTLDGLMIGRYYILARQLSGSGNQSANSELFRYDGRVVVNPPPGFTGVQRSPSIWNEGVPGN